MHTSGSWGTHLSIAVDATGAPWISYYDIMNGGLVVARHVGSGGTGCASAAWACGTVDTSSNVGSYTSLAFDATGNPWISYRDNANAVLKVARYVSSGGTGCDAANLDLHDCGHDSEHHRCDVTGLRRNGQRMGELPRDHLRRSSDRPVRHIRWQRMYSRHLVDLR